MFASNLSIVPDKGEHREEREYAGAGQEHHDFQPSQSILTAVLPDVRYSQGNTT